MEVSVVWASIDIILERKQGPEFEGKNIIPPKVTGNGLLTMAQEKLFLRKYTIIYKDFLLLTKIQAVKTQLSCQRSQWCVTFILSLLMQQFPQRK